MVWTRNPNTKPKLESQPYYKHPNKYIKWFFWKKHPRSKLRYEQFGIHLTIVICSLFLFWVIYSNIERLNNVKLLIIELGSLVLLILFFIIIWGIYRLLKNLRYGIRGLANGYRAIISVVVVIFCFILFLKPNILVNPITSFNYDSLNPFDVNLSSFNNSDDSYYIDDYNSDNNSNDNNDDFWDWDDKGYENPTYQEMINFLNQDPIDKNEYIFGSYVCHNFACDTIENAGQKGIRAGYVHLKDPVGLGHAIICFQTTDKGLYFDEPQFDSVFSELEMNNMISRGKYDIVDDTSWYFDFSLIGYDIEWWND